MYEYFEGKIVDFYDSYLVVDIAGIGYRLEAPKNILSQVRIGEEKVIYAEQVVSENRISVYGFATKEDREMFNILRTVPKIGPKTAIGILGSVTLSKLVASIVSEDKATLTKLPGIGAKSAERLIIDMKDKVKDFEFAIEDIDAQPKSSLHSELVEALTQFGYNRFEIEKKIAHIDFEGMTIDEALKFALKNMN